MAFIKNQGQWDSRAQYLASMGGGDVWLTKQGYVLDVHQRISTAIQGQVVRVSFSGGNSSYADGEQLPGKMNYFIGNVPSKWTTNVPRFAEATAQHMLPGLDIRYYFDQGSPRYDLILAPGIDPSSIAMNFEGANGLNVLPSGNLQIETSLGPIEERGLVAYQQQGSVRVSVPCQMVVTGSTVHFQLADYDKSKPLVIDPLLFCTYWSMFNYAGLLGPRSICADSSQNIITIGETDFKNFPTTSGAYQSSSISYFGAGYISKLSADGKQLVFGTYLSGTALNVGMGGTFSDQPLAVTTDLAGGIYLAGQATSNDFPVTAGAIQTKKGAPSNATPNAFIAELSPDGSRLVFSTYLSGTKFTGNSLYGQPGDYATDIRLDSKGNVIVSGVSQSLDFPLTLGAYSAKKDPAESAEGFVVKINNLGTELLFSTLIPGANSDDSQSFIEDSRNQLVVDASDNIFLGGQCNSTFFKPTVGPYNVAGGVGYLAKLSSDGSKRLFGIELAGPPSSIDMGPNGVMFVAGSPGSTKWPALYDQAGTYHFGLTAANNGACLGQFSSDGTTLLHSAVMQYAPYALHTDKAGNIYLFGTSYIPNLPTTSDAYQQTPGFAYFAELSPEQDKLLYGSYFGANQSGPLLDAFAPVNINRFALVGGVPSGGAPVTAGAYNTTSGQYFVGLLSLPIYTHVELTPNPVVGGVSVTGKVTLPASAPVGGSVITLTSSDAGVKVPASVTVPAGAISQTFAVTTTGVATNTTATISAKFGVGTGTAKLVRTQAALASLDATPTTILAGQTVTATVKLNGLAGLGGDLVQLSSANPNATVPASTVIYNGSGLATFQIKTAIAATSYTSQITAKFGAVTKTVQIEVDPCLSSLTISSASVVAGATAQGVVKFSGKAASAVTVSLSSSTSAATVPSSVIVPAGATLVAFNITTAGVNVATTATITAKEGSLTQTVTLTITPAVLSFFTLSPTSVKGGTGVQGIVRLNGPAGPAGVSVTLSSPSTSATVPAKVVIAPGASYFVVAIGTKPVTTSTPVSLKAVSGTTLTAVLTINP
jgi:hypothetical protein